MENSNNADELKTVECANCTQPMERRTAVLASMVRVDGFYACSNTCRKLYQRKSAA